MRNCSLVSADARHHHRHHRGSVLLVVLGVLTVLSLIGLSFVLLTRTESGVACNSRLIAHADIAVQSEVDRVRALLLDDLYDTGDVTALCWRMVRESHDYPNDDDGWLFGYRADGQPVGVPPTPVLQVSFGYGATPTWN